MTNAQVLTSLFLNNQQEQPDQSEQNSTADYSAATWVEPEPRTVHHTTTDSSPSLSSNQNTQLGNPIILIYEDSETSMVCFPPFPQLSLFNNTY